MSYQRLAPSTHIYVVKVDLLLVSSSFSLVLIDSLLSPLHRGGKLVDLEHKNTKQTSL